MRLRSLFVTALLAASPTLIGSIAPAQAQEKDAVTETARRRFQEGVKFFDQKRYEEARAAFLQAYALKRHPAVLLNLAQSEIRSGHTVEAARHFAGFLKESSAASPVERGEAEKGLAAARSKLGRIVISVNVGGADILVDGESVGQAPLTDPVDVTPGSHSVVAKLGSRSAEANVSVMVAHMASATLALDGSGTAAAPPVATAPIVTATAAPPPPIETRPTPSPEPAPDLLTSDTSVRVSSGGREPFFHWLTHSGGGLAGLGITTLGVGVFAGFGIASQTASSNVDSVVSAIQSEASARGLAVTDPATGKGLCGSPVQPGFETACSTLRDNMDKRDLDRTVATVGLVVAGVGATATVVAYFLGSGRSDTGERTMLVPVFGPHATGLSLTGDF